MSEYESTIPAGVLDLALEDLVWKALGEWGGEWSELPLDIAKGAIVDLLIFVEGNYPDGLDTTLRDLGVGLDFIKTDGEWR